MLDFAGETLMLLFGFWRFLFSASYRERKLEEWREARRSAGGLEIVALEIAAAIAFGVMLPVWLVVSLLAQ